MSITIGDNRLKSNSKNNQVFTFTIKSFFNEIIGFSQSRSNLLGDIDGSYQLIAGSYKSDRLINITVADKISLKCDCFNGSFVIGIREPILYSLALDQPPRRKLYREPGIKIFKKINKSVLSHIMFYLEDDDRKPVDFHNETISFTCQLIEI